MSRFEQVNGLTVVPLWINGAPTELDQSRLITVHSAAHDKDVFLAQSASISDAQSAVSSAETAFQSWKETSYVDRRELLLRVATVMERRIDEFILFQTQETSCSETWARFNVILACKALREICSCISTSCTGELPPPENKATFALVLKEPVGPVLAIAPWNGSVILATKALTAPLAAGCTVVFKASELCPRTHHAIVESFHEAGLPRGCLNQLQVRREDANEVTECIIANPSIRKIEFIGSANVGRIIGQLAAKYLKPVLMELGGKCPAVVLKDADLKKAAGYCAAGAFMNHGQICVSTERLIVVREVAEEFAHHLKEAVLSHQGHAGSAVTKDMAEKAHKMVHSAVDRGATFVVGSAKFVGTSGASLEPSILTEVNPTDDLYSQETFGPSASLFVVDNEDQAVALANNTSYGLGASVHSRDILAALRVARRIDCGVVNINSVTMYDEPTIPAGGTKGSGWGRGNGKYALREFLLERTIVIHDDAARIAFGGSAV